MPADFVAALAEKTWDTLTQTVPIGRNMGIAVIAAAIHEALEEAEKIGHANAKRYEQQRSAKPDEELWWRARKCEAEDYAAAIAALREGCHE